MASNVFTNVHPHFQPEEAAHAAFEFVASLDNLPGEVTFLLQEIAEKEAKMINLRTRINHRHYGLTKNVKNLNSSSSSGTTTPTSGLTLPISSGQPLPTGHLSQKDQQAMQKIQGEWLKVEQLQAEKIRLATRLEQIVSRARERGKAEWKKVGGMDLEEIESKEGKPAFGELGGGEVLLPSGGLGSGSDRPLKKRKPNAIAIPVPGGSPSVNHPSATSMPPPPAPRPSLSARGSSRHNRHVSTSTLSEDMDVDAEGEFETGDADGEVDQSLYCYCQQPSYGEMIGCDNNNCEFEWFHVKCVSIVGEAPDTWYCPSCVQKLGLSSSSGQRAGDKRSGRGRKK